MLKNVTDSYTCNQCFHSQVQHVYNYKAELSRISEATDFGDQYMTSAARRESRILDKFAYYGKPPVSAVCRLRDRSVRQKPHG
ncbi:hypothetical protein ScPMuIL_017522 [Solemya velum]